MNKPLDVSMMDQLINNYQFVILPPGQTLTQRLAKKIKDAMKRHVHNKTSVNLPTMMRLNK